MQPLLTDPARAWKTAVFSRYYGGEAMVTERYLYAEWKGKEGRPLARMLYDHATDPLETRNIAETPEGAPIAERLRRQMDAGWRPVAAAAASVP